MPIAAVFDPAEDGIPFVEEDDVLCCVKPLIRYMADGFSFLRLRGKINWISDLNSSQIIELTHHPSRSHLSSVGVFQLRWTVAAYPGGKACCPVIKTVT